MWDEIIANTTVYLLVFARMGGMILLNPLFSRKNLPSRVKIGLVLALTLLLAPVVDVTPIADYGTWELVEGVVRELLLGFVCSLLFQAFYYMLFFVGDIMDTQMGMSMAKVFDPGSNIQASISGNFFSILFMLLIFATDSHLLLLRIFGTSYQIIPLGAAGISMDIANYMLTIFISAFSLALRLALPFVAVEFTLEVSMGVLMKLIPQIHVFVINIQLKMLIGIFMLIAFAQPICIFLDNYGAILFRKMEEALYILAG